jgi:hypothetical protein
MTGLAWMGSLPDHKYPDINGSGSKKKDINGSEPASLDKKQQPP